MKVFKRKNAGLQISRTAALNSTPVKNREVNELRLESGEILLTYPVAIRPWIAAVIRRLGGPADKIQTKKLQLDTLGTSVWDLLNGKRSVNQIIRRFAQTHRVHAKEAELAVTRFLRDLGRRGLIGLR